MWTSRCGQGESLEIEKKETMFQGAMRDWSKRRCQEVQVSGLATRCRMVRSQKTRMGPGLGDRGCDVFETPRCQVDRWVYRVDQGAMTYKQP